VKTSSLPFGLLAFARQVHAITLTAFHRTGNWTSGLGVTWVGDNDDISKMAVRGLSAMRRQTMRG
jgi:hypothetical protein